MPEQHHRHTSECAEQATSARKVKVEVVATRHEDEGVGFQCLWEDDRGNWHSGPIVFAHDSGAHMVEFTLDDRSGLNLNFEKEVDNAIWINADTCPKSANGDDKGQIEDKQVITSDRKLKLKNLNKGEPCNLHYALRFTGDPWTSSEGKRHGPAYAYDPELRNRGGTR